MIRWFLMVSLISISVIASEYKELTLQEALSIAKKQNLEINIAKFDQKVSELGIDIAKGYKYGKLDAQVLALRSNDAGNVFGFKLQSREADFGDFGFDEFLNSFGQPGVDLLSIVPDKLNYPGSRNHFDTKLSYMIPLYTAKKLDNYKEIAKSLHDMSKLDSKKVMAEKFFQIKKAYYDISLLINFESDISKIVTNIEKLKDTIKEMRKEGYAKKTDLLEVESKLSNVIRMTNQTKAYKELSYQFLSFLLDSDVVSIAPISLETSPQILSKDEIVKKNADIKKAKLGLEITSRMLSVSKAAYMPEIGAFLEYGSSDDKFLNDFKDHDRYTVGVQLKYNIFNGGIDQAKIEQERLNVLKVNNQIELAQKGIALKVSKIQTEIKSYNFQINSLKKELELTNEIYNSYQERYKEGLASINDVVIKQSQQIEKLLKLQEAQNKRNEKILQLAKLAQE